MIIRTGSKTSTSSPSRLRLVLDTKESAQVGNHRSSAVSVCRQNQVRRNDCCKSEGEKYPSMSSAMPRLHIVTPKGKNLACRQSRRRFDAIRSRVWSPPNTLLVTKTTRHLASIFPLIITKARIL